MMYLHNTLRVIGDSRVNLFRVKHVMNGETEDVNSQIQFWYVGCVHDLERPAGNLSDDFYKYAEDYLRQTAIESNTEEQHVELSSPFLTRSKAKALSEKENKLALDEVDEFIPDQYENEGKSRKRKNGNDEFSNKRTK